MLVTLALLEAGMDEKTITKAEYQHASVHVLGLTDVCSFGRCDSQVSQLGGG